MPAARLCLRRIVLQEDRASVCMPQCHGTGLIRYCTENKRLHILRRVDLWRAVLVPYGISPYSLMIREEAYLVADPTKQMPWFNARRVGAAMAPWIVAANHLTADGMPSGQFSLLLQGDESWSDLFVEFVQDAAAWQTAAEEAMACGKLRAPSLQNLRWTQHEHFVVDGFPKAVYDIVWAEGQERFNTSSPLQCTFWPGNRLDTQELVTGEGTWAWWSRGATPDGFEENCTWLNLDHHDPFNGPDAPDYRAFMRRSMFPLLNHRPFWEALHDHLVPGEYRDPRTILDDGAEDHESASLPHGRYCYLVSHLLASTPASSWTPDSEARYHLPARDRMQVPDGQGRVLDHWSDLVDLRNYLSSGEAGQDVFL
jgi:hypothetical protein